MDYLLKKKDSNLLPINKALHYYQALYQNLKPKNTLNFLNHLASMTYINVIGRVNQ